MADRCVIVGPVRLERLHVQVECIAHGWRWDGWDFETAKVVVRAHKRLTRRRPG